jgi:hypothetical protein
VAGLAPRDEEPRERLREDGGVGIRSMRVQMAQRLGDAAAGADSPGELECRAPLPGTCVLDLDRSSVAAKSARARARDGGDRVPR